MQGEEEALGPGLPMWLLVALEKGASEMWVEVTQAWEAGKKREKNKRENQGQVGTRGEKVRCKDLNCQSLLLVFGFSTVLF